MNRTAAFNTAVCSLAIAALSAGTTTFVGAASGAALDLFRALGAAACVAVGTWLVYLGHCRGMMAKPR